MKHQILIASYKPDFIWLRQCLRSLEKFSTGFLPPTVAVPKEDFDEAMKMIATCGAVNVDLKAFDHGTKFGRAQLAMMHGDSLCPDADYYWLLGSDCLATAPFSPANYCDATTGLPFMLYHTWEFLEKHGRECLFWRAGTEAALGDKSHGEFMRRLPIAYRRETARQAREWITKNVAPMPFVEYVNHEVNVNRNFSESNVLGEFAWHRAPFDYVWVNLDFGLPAGWPLSPIRQFWSHGGFQRPSDGDGRTPRAVITEALGSF